MFYILQYIIRIVYYNKENLVKDMYGLNEVLLKWEICYIDIMFDV